jgi:tetratricopeptide (TPR) repeat protein
MQKHELLKELKKHVAVAINLLNTKKFDEAINMITPLIKKFPKAIILYNILGLCYNAKNNPRKALDIFEYALKLNSENIHVLNNLGLVHTQLSNYQISEKYLKKALKINPYFLDASINLAKIQFFAFNSNKAIDTLKKIYNKNINNYDINITLAHIYLQMGNFNKANIYYQKCLEINPINCRPHLGLSKITKYSLNSVEFKKLKNKLSEINENEGKMFLHFAIAKAYEDINDYENSNIHIQKANNLKNLSINYNINNEILLFKNIKQFFNSSKINQIKHGEKKILFVLGMPRSGTSLIEQILSSHKKVFGAGELDYLNKIIKKKFLLNNNSFNKKNINNYKNSDFEECHKEYLNYLDVFQHTEEYLVDKTPLNFRWIGFILKIFPNSKIIHCSRNPMDICWSNYKNYFASSNLNFTYNLNTLGKFFNLYRDLMNYWNNLFSNKIYHIKYENLINDNENEIKKLLQFCELNWDQNCLKFYKNKRKVSTASTTQVREPIYKSSVTKWKSYTKYLEKLKKIINQ